MSILIVRCAPLQFNLRLNGVEKDDVMMMKKKKNNIDDDEVQKGLLRIILTFRAGN